MDHQHQANAKKFFAPAAPAEGTPTPMPKKSKGTLHLPRKVLTEIVIPPVKDRGTAMSEAFRALYGKQQEEKAHVPDPARDKG